jgi:maleylacetate reductase
VKAFVHDALPGRIVFGVGAVARVGEEAERLGATRALVVTDAAAMPVAERVVDQLDGRSAGVFADVRQHVPEGLAAAAREAATAAGADCVITVGGGSATGLGKAIGVTSGVSILAVPTTYAGSEMTPIYGVTGQHKETGRDLRALPRVVVYDPELTTGLPAAVTAASGLNAIAHCVEALYGPGANPLIALYAEDGIRALASSLPVLATTPGDLDARSKALYGACLAGTSLAVGGIALQHRLAHSIGGTFNLVHGDVHAVLLPHVAAFNAPAAPDALGRVSRALGAGDDPQLAGAALYDLAVAIGAPTDLAGIGMPADGIGPAAERAVAELGADNPRAVDVDDVRVLLRAAYDGTRPSHTTGGE